MGEDGGGGRGGGKEQDKLEDRERARETERVGKGRGRESKSNDLHMVSCWSLNTVTIDICWGLLGLISRTQL